MDITSLAYKRAFEAYIRRGTPIGLSLKQAQTTTHYIWRTRGDGKVRASHAVNNGKVFSWDNPPSTGHPGEEYGCRCIAEPYELGIQEHMTMVMSGISDAGKRWEDGIGGDFADHYWSGNGRAVRLRDTGHLQSVVNEYKKQREIALLGQVADAARKNAGSSFVYDFENTYEMQHVVFDLGETTIGGIARGSSRVHKTGALSIVGRCDFYLEDEFKDPIDIFDIIPGNIELFGSRTYRIYDDWQASFSGVVILNRGQSKYVQ